MVIALSDLLPLWLTDILTTRAVCICLNRTLLSCDGSWNPYFIITMVFHDHPRLLVVTISGLLATLTAIAFRR